MKVLFVTLKALETNTSVTKSNIGLINGIRDLGYEIDIVMPEIDKSLFYYDDCFDISSINVYRIKNQNIGSKLASVSSGSVGFKQRILDLLRVLYYKFKILDRGTQLLNEAKNINIYNNYYDYIISTSDPKSSHLFVKRMIKEGLKYGKWIQHWGDPLASDITCDSIYPMFLKKNIEKKIIADADRVIYVSPFTLEYQKKQYRKIQNKMDFVPLACDINNDFCTENDDTFDLLKKDQLKITYLGDYNSKIRNIIPLYNACKTDNRYSLIIAGNTDLSLTETSNIKILPRIPSDKVKKLENESDVIISIGNLQGNQIPGKLYYAASSQNIVLFTLDGEYKKEMKEYIDSFDRFECCENNEKSIKATLDGIYRSLIIEENKKIYCVPEMLQPINVVKRIMGE